MNELPATTDCHLADFSDKLEETHRTCAFLLEAYDAIIRSMGDTDDATLSGGTLLAQDIRHKFDELENLLGKIRKQIVG